MQIVASLTAERDGEIRKAALNTLATGYKILGVSYHDVIRLLHYFCLGKIWKVCSFAYPGSFIIKFVGLPLLVFRIALF